jgi:hypothetical protein
MKQPTEKPRFTRILWWIGGIFGGLILLSSIVIGLKVTRTGHIPTIPDNSTISAPSSDDLTVPMPDIDYSNARPSDSHLFRVS